ncbi:MAG: hypothetical protein L0027_06540, partial [Candidatus Rokubacteria bacterium]|nr:hypothetical protein [Candidatus Rokubacteria bacterium]
EELLAVPLDEEGPAVEVVPRADAPPGRIVIAASALPGSPPGSAGAVVVLQHPPRLVPLDPDPNPAASSLRKGGTAYRYYRMVAGPEVVVGSGGLTRFYSAVFRVRETGREFSNAGLFGAPSSHTGVLRDLLSSQPGLLAVRIPYPALGDAATPVPATRTVDLVAFRDPGGSDLAPEEPLSFAVNLEERSFSRTLEYSTGALGGLVGKLALGGQGSLTVVDRDFALPGVDEQLIGLRAAGGGGLEIGLDLKLGFGIDGPEAKALSQTVAGLDFRFVPADADPAVRDFVLNQAAHAASLGQRTLGSGLTTVIGDLADPETGLFRAVADVLTGRVTAEAIRDRTEATVIAGVVELVPLDLSIKATLPFDEESEAFLEFSAVNVEVTATVEVATNIGRESPGRTARLTLSGALEFLKIGGLGLVFCP